MECRDYVCKYLDWLQKQYSYRQIDEVTEITTPLTNNIGDNLRVYLESVGKNKIRLSDDGTTLEDLELMGIDISTSTREYIISNILRQYNVSLDKEDDSLYIDGSE
ncbi:MAG: DUF1828 domain-containing protein, partial [Firmicutes bacterium]|nr:DUF1828 domain-containing protein [Candidatus Gallilactobacillus intestinavium]